MIRVNVKITHAIGVWNGFLQSDVDLTRADAESVVDQLIQNVNDVQHLAIKHTDGSQTVFNQAIFAASVISYNVVEEVS